MVNNIEEQDSNAKLLDVAPDIALDKEQEARNRHWGSKAKAYNQQWVDAHADAVLYRQLEAQLLTDHLDAGPGKKVLDVCCGTGRNTLALAETGATVWGLDGASEMLEQARINTSEAGYDVEFSLGDARALPYADNQFDGVAGTRFMYMVEGADKHKVVSEFARVVRPGGKIALQFNNGCWGIKNELGAMLRGKKPRFRDRYLWPGQSTRLFEGLRVDAVVGVKCFRLALISKVIGKQAALKLNRTLQGRGLAQLSAYSVVLATKE